MNIVIRMVCAVILLSRPAGVCLAAASEDPERKAVWSTVGIQLYGYVKLDSAYDTGQAVPGNFVKWVDLDSLDPHDNQFSMTANESRLGVWLRGPEVEERSLETTGRVEIDFYGGGDENKPRPLLRHAYVDLDWQESGWRFLAGQASDVISPLYPGTINYPVAWWAGNVGFRRPQMRLTKGIVLSEASEMELVGALSRDIGSTVSTFTGVDSGADAGLPGIQARVGWKVGKAERGPVGFGLSGHWGKESFDLNGEGDHEEFDSWSANLDLRVPVTRKVVLQAEAYTGVNLAQYLGGVGQGVNLDSIQEIGDTGGWLSFDLGPYGPITYHLGASLSDVDDEDIEAGDRALNASMFANANCVIYKHIRFGLELSYWQTGYKEPDDLSDDAESFRLQFAVYYRF